MDRQVICFPKNQLTIEQRDDLKLAGFVVIEIDDPEKVRLILPTSNLINADDLFIAALDGMNTAGSYATNKFVEVLRDRLLKREKLNKT
jgi:hypothetical protein